MEDLWMCYVRYGLARNHLLSSYDTAIYRYGSTTSLLYSGYVTAMKPYAIAMRPYAIATP
jgi:hypothetical protein